MQTPQKFIFEKYEWRENDKTAFLTYSYDSETFFTEKIKFGFDFIEYNKQALDLAIRGLWYMAGVSYYKALLPKQIEIKHYELDKWQAEFLTKTWTLGLGEFFYRNKIDFRGLIQFPHSDKARNKCVKINGLEGALLPIGGGKDSLVSSALLDENGKNYDTITVGQYPFLNKMIKKIGKNHLTVTRTVSQKLIELNQQGAYNGHVPISSIWASIFVVAAVLTGKKEIILSNESSANEENVEIYGVKINHQYSKSLEFEQDFNHFVTHYISPDINYYSLLRKYNELEITKIFVEKCWDKYKNDFVSCNRNFTLANINPQKRWCGECSKCCFVGIMLAAYLPKKEVIKMFGKDIFELPQNQKMFRELAGLEGHKPFECVGTPEEVKKAIKMAKL